MKKKTTDIVAYLTWIGLLVAFLAGDRKNSKFHLNQALVLFVTEVAWQIIYRVAAVVLNFLSFGLLGSILYAINTIIGLLFLVLLIMGLVNAIQEQEKPLPLIGWLVLYH